MTIKIRRNLALQSYPDTYKHAKAERLNTSCRKRLYKAEEEAEKRRSLEATWLTMKRRATLQKSLQRREESGLPYKY